MPIKTIKHEIIAKWFFILIFVGVAGLFWKVIEPFAIVLLTAMIVAIVLAPLERHVRTWTGHPKVSAIIMLLLVFSAIVLPLATIILLTANQAVQIMQDTVANPAWLKAFNVQSLPFINSLPSVLVAQLITIDPAEIVRNLAIWIVNNVGTIFANSADVIFKTFIFFVSLYFFFVDREKIHAELNSLSPLQSSIDESIVKRLIQTVRGVVFGSLIIAIVQGIVAGIGLTIFGVPGSLILALLVMVVAQIPMIGTSIIMLPAVVYLLVIGSIPQAIGLFIWSMLAVGLIDNLIQPFVVGNRTKIHALLILLSMLGGINLFGPIGFILGPTILAAFLVMVELYRSGILEKNKV